MSLVLYELAGAHPDRRFSPYCWRSHFCLWHKQLPFTTVPWRYNDKALIAKTGQGKVPVINDGKRWVHDSWQIALYLEQQYPQHPLFVEGQGRAEQFSHWCDSELNPALRWFLLKVIHGHLTPGDQAYFRRTREAQIGMTLEQSSQQADSDRLNTVLSELEDKLAEQDWFAGEQPGYSDYALMGSLLWAAATFDEDPLDGFAPLLAWRSCLSQRYSGLKQYLFYYPL